MCHFNKETFLSCLLEWSPSQCSGLSSSTQGRAGAAAFIRCCRALPMAFLQCCFLLLLSRVPAPVRCACRSPGLWLLIISSPLLRGCLLIFLPLVKLSLLASRWDLFSYLLLLFAYYKSGSREKFCIKMKGNLKNELVMRAINQSSLQHQQYYWVCCCEGDRMRGLVRNMNYLGLWCGNLLHKVQREAVWRRSHSFPSHKRGCPAGIMTFSSIQQFLPAGSTGWL